MGSCVSTRKRSNLPKNNKQTNKPTAHDDIVKFPHLRRLHSRQILDNPTGDKIFRRYQFGKELGRGEFGVTYHCRDTRTGDAVACKKISKSRLKASIDIEDVRREVEIMRHLPKHPNIVSYREVYEDKDAIYLVMEICEGGELFDRIIAKGHYTERAAATAIKTMLEVVKVIISV